MAKIIHRVLFLVGSCLLFFSLSLLSWEAISPGLPYALGLVAAYFWIRQDIWKSKIDTKTGSNRSRREDCRVAFVLLFLIAIVQEYSLDPAARRFFPIMLLIGVPVSNWIAPTVDKVFGWAIDQLNCLFEKIVNRGKS